MRIALNNDLKLNEDLFAARSKALSPRQGFGDVLVELGEKHKDIVVLTADLKESTKTDKFAEKFPERFIDVGIAEQNMAGIAAGLASSGKIPFITSFSTFSPGRNWEQIKQAICYSNLNVKIVGTHCGLSAASDGPTQQSLEDIATTRILPNLTVIEPADYLQTQKAIIEAIKLKGPVYIRLNRNSTPQLTSSETPFNIGEAQVLKEGRNAAIIACGPLVYEALKAARELELKNKIDVAVVNMHTIKPLDERTLLKIAEKTKLIVTLEEHQIAGGLGGAVAEFLSENKPTHVFRMGMKDTFGQSGEYEELLDKYGLTYPHIVSQVKSLFGHK